MSQKAYLFSTNGIGDGTSPYTQNEWSLICQILSNSGCSEGVVIGMGGGLQGTVTGANTVSINTGGAIVDGKPYYNFNAEAVTIPSAVGGGNTRIDRIVLRADWTAQTVRIYRIAGVDAGSPSAPAITQTSGTTYDITLYQALVDTGGTVTLTDERTLSLVVGGKISNDSIDDTKLGARVPQFYRRQGGSATDWPVTGINPYDPGAVRMQAGAVEWSGGAAGSGTVTITFPVAFSALPLVMASVAGISSAGVVATECVAISATQATLNWYGSVNQTVVSMAWLAIGPE